MIRRRFTAEQIIHKLREAEVELAPGKTIPEAFKKIRVTDQTYYRWRKEYGGLRTDQAKKLKELGEGERAAQAGGSRYDARQRDPERRGPPKLLSPPRRRRVEQPRPPGY